MTSTRQYFSEVKIAGVPLAAIQRGEATLRDRQQLKEFLEFVHIKKGLLEAYGPGYPVVEIRELLPSFEKNFNEYHLPAMSLVVFNRPLNYQAEIFQFDLLHAASEGRKRGLRENLDRVAPHLDKNLRSVFKQRFALRDLTDLAYYEELLEFLFHMDRAQVIAKDDQGVFRLLGLYASFPSDLDTELKDLGFKMGKFKKQDNAVYEREREFVYQFLMELYGFPIAAERRTSAALFARKLSRLKEPYLIKVLGASDRTVTSLSGFEQKRYPLVEKTALVALPPGMAEAHPHLADQGYFVDPDRRVVIFTVTYQQHKYNRLNVLEDRALSVLKQEIIHPYHGGRDSSLNLLKDSRRILKDLTDIVRGEYTGSIAYQRTELLTSTKTHEERLKFLSAWLGKNQRRLATYSQESFEAAKKLLNSYLLNREYREAFSRHAELHREVVRRVVYLTQAQHLHTLERLARGDAGGRHLGPHQRMAQAVAFLEEKQDELPYYYPDLFDKCLRLWEELLDYPYFRRLKTAGAPPNLPYRRKVWQLMLLGQRLIKDLTEQHRLIQAEAGRGVPLPVAAKPRAPVPAKP